MGKKILITGASTGIGAASALELAPGNELFVHYNNSKSEAEYVAAGVNARGGRAHLVRADLMNEAGCKALHEVVAAETDRLDVLVNNAGGMLQRHDVKTVTWDLMERIFALNTFSTMLVTRLFIPLLEKSGNGCIVNMTSIAMRTGSPTSTLYASSKAAVDSFTRGSARELAPKIRVNAIAPGVILTPFHDRYSSTERLDKLKKDTPLGEHGAVEHIASAIRFLIDNDFITGETIDINGGMFMR
ncbi:MAG: SDR family NAD(P)-dependent oxidoreductase [Rhodothermales bacterium]